MSGALRRTWVIALVIGLAGCSGNDTRAVAVLDACGTEVVKLAGPTAKLVYRGSEDVVADVPVLCKRLKALRTKTHVDGVGRDRLVIEVPASYAAQARSAAKTGRLAFYDWEANLIGPGGQPSPEDPKVTGGPAAGQVESLSHYDALLRASKRPAVVEPDNAREGSVHYAVDAKVGEVLGAGSPARAGALEAVPAAQREQAKVLEVKPGTVVVRAEQTSAVAANADRWFVLEDNAALRGKDVVSPEQRTSTGPGASGEPIVTFDFTGDGATDFVELTRELARRGSRAASIAGHPDVDANQHFAIVLDDQIVTVPFVDFRANPKGIDGAEGAQIQGGLTVASARLLASILRNGELPVALEPVGATAP
jgi:SecD/SecF fusion protein